MVPSAEAIMEEEGDNVIMARPPGGGMFKRNSHIDDGDDTTMRQTATNYH